MKFQTGSGIWHPPPLNWDTLHKPSQKGKRELPYGVRLALMLVFWCVIEGCLLPLLLLERQCLELAS